MEWQEILFSVLGTILTAICSWCLSKLIMWINNKIKDEKLKSYLTTIINSISAAVKATYQTYVENIKGTEFWTADAQKNALEQALTTIKSELSKECLDFIENNFGDVEMWIKNQIESILYDLKNNKEIKINEEI